MLGDIVLGIPSSGIHSNGFSLVRKICSAYGVDLNAPPPFAGSTASRLVDELLTPTKIYIKCLMPALALSDSLGEPAVKAMAHITGGGLPDNVPRGIAEGLGVKIDATSWPMLPVFRCAVESRELSTTHDDTTHTLAFSLSLSLTHAHLYRAPTYTQMDGSCRGWC